MANSSAFATKARLAYTYDKTVALRLVQHALQLYKTEEAIEVLHDIVSNPGDIYDSKVLNHSTSRVIGIRYQSEEEIIIAKKNGVILYFNGKGEFRKKLNIDTIKYSPLMDIYFSKSGNLILTGHKSGNSFLWNKKGDLIQKYISPGMPVKSCQISPDEDYILINKDTIGDGGTTFGMKLKTFGSTIIMRKINGEFCFKKMNKTRTLTSVFYNNHDVIISDSKSLNVYNHKGKKIKKLKIRLNAFETIRDIIISPSNNIYTSYFTGSLNQLNRKGKKAYSFSPHEDNFYDTRISKNDITMVTAGKNGEAKMWDIIASHRLYAELIGHRSSLYMVDINFDGTKVITADEDGNVKLWNIYNQILSSSYSTIRLDYDIKEKIKKKHKINLKEYQLNYASLYKISANNNFLLGKRNHPDSFFTALNHIHLINKDFESMKTWNLNVGAIEDFTISNDEKFCAIVGDSTGVRIIELDSQKLFYFYSPYNFSTIEFSHDGNKIYGGTKSGSLIVFDKDDSYSEQFFSQNEHTKRITNICVSKNGKFIVTGDSEGKVIVWSPEGKIINKINTSYFISHLDISPDDKYYLFGNSNEIILMDFEGNKWQTIRNKKSYSIFESFDNVSFEPDNKFIRTISNNNDIRWYWRWDAFLNSNSIPQLTAKQRNEYRILKGN